MDQGSRGVRQPVVKPDIQLSEPPAVSSFYARHGIYAISYLTAPRISELVIPGPAAPTTTASPDPEVAGRYRGRLDGRPGPGSLSEEAAVSFAPELGVPPTRRRRCGPEAEAELGPGERSRRSRGGEAAEERGGIGGRDRGAPAAALPGAGGRPPDGEADRGRHVDR